jgi:hypothetical protein
MSSFYNIFVLDYSNLPEHRYLTITNFFFFSKELPDDIYLTNTKYLRGSHARALLLHQV